MSTAGPQAPGKSAKVEQIVRRCVHAMATGKWRAGMKLPSVRRAEAEWSVNRLTVLAAYRDLAARGLAVAVSRSGYFVADTPGTSRLSRHRVELERLYESVAEQIGSDTGLSPLGAFRYLAELAESTARERPECVFVECTRHEARLYAAQVTAALAVPCLAMTTGEIDGRWQRVPSHVRTLITTAYHRQEVSALGSDADGVLAVCIPAIERAPEVAAWVAARSGRVALMGIDALVIEQMAADLGETITLQELAAEGVDAAVSDRLGAGEAVLLSPTLWEAASEGTRNHDEVRPFEYRIGTDAFEQLADELGLPLGALR